MDNRFRDRARASRALKDSRRSARKGKALQRIAFGGAF